MRRIVFMFSGLGAQYYQMGAELYARDPAYRDAIDRCAEIAGPIGGRSLARIMFERPMAESDRFDSLIEANLTLFAQGWAMTRALAGRGIRPDALVGYSLGELIASVVADALPLETVIEILKAEAWIMEHETPPAAMIAVLAEPSLLALDPVLEPRCTIGAVNAGAHFVVTVAEADVAAVTAALDRRAVSWARLPVRRGFHAPFIDPAEGALRRLCFALPSAPPRIPQVSCALAGPVSRFDADHIWRVVRGPVRFLDTIRHVADTMPDALCIDCGPAGTLATLSRLALGDRVKAMPAMNQFGRNLDTLNQIEAELR